MKNKEAYKQAFKHVHYQKEVNLNKKRISKPLVTIMTSFIVLLSTFTVAYAFDVGGIQSKLEVWFRGEKRKVQYKEEDKNAYHFYTTDEDGNVVDMGINMGFKGSLTGIEPMSGDELAESMNDDSEIVYDEKEDKYLVGIEFDYSVADGSDSILERDVYHPSFMESRGWNIYRVWSRDWWLNKSKVVNAIKKEISNARGH